MELFQLTQGTQGARKNSALYGSSNNSSYTETATDENGFSYKDLLEQFQDQRNLGKKNQDQVPTKSTQPTPIKETSAEEMLGNLSRMSGSFNAASRAVLGSNAKTANNADTKGLSYSKTDVDNIEDAIAGNEIGDKDTFDKLDLNNDGKITGADLERIKNLLANDQDGDGIFGKSDKDAIFNNKNADLESLNALSSYAEKESDYNMKELKKQKDSAVGEKLINAEKALKEARDSQERISILKNNTQIVESNRMNQYYLKMNEAQNTSDKAVRQAKIAEANKILEEIQTTKGKVNQSINNELVNQSQKMNEFITNNNEAGRTRVEYEKKLLEQNKLNQEQAAEIKKKVAEAQKRLQEKQKLEEQKKQEQIPSDEKKASKIEELISKFNLKKLEPYVNTAEITDADKKDNPVITGAKGETEPTQTETKFVMPEITVVDNPYANLILGPTGDDEEITPVPKPKPIPPTPTPPPVPPTPEPTPNNNDEIALSFSNADLEKVKNHLSGIDKITAPEIIAKYDFDGNGEITVFDLNRLDDLVAEDTNGDGVFDEADAAALRANPDKADLVKLWDKVNDNYNEILGRLKPVHPTPDPVPPTPIPNPIYNIDKINILDKRMNDILSNLSLDDIKEPYFYITKSNINNIYEVINPGVSFSGYYKIGNDFIYSSSDIFCEGSYEFYSNKSSEAYNSKTYRSCPINSITIRENVCDLITPSNTIKKTGDVVSHDNNIKISFINNLEEVTDIFEVSGQALISRNYEEGDLATYIYSYSNPLNVNITQNSNPFEIYGGNNKDDNILLEDDTKNIKINAGDGKNNIKLKGQGHTVFAMQGRNSIRVIGQGHKIISGSEYGNVIALERLEKNNNNVIDNLTSNDKIYIGTKKYDIVGLTAKVENGNIVICDANGIIVTLNGITSSMAEIEYADYDGIYQKTTINDLLGIKPTTNIDPIPTPNPNPNPTPDPLVISVVNGTFDRTGDVELHLEDNKVDKVIFNSQNAALTYNAKTDDPITIIAPKGNDKIDYADVYGSAKINFGDDRRLSIKSINTPIKVYTYEDDVYISAQNGDNYISLSGKNGEVHIGNGNDILDIRSEGTRIESAGGNNTYRFFAHAKNTIIDNFDPSKDKFEFAYALGELIAEHDLFDTVIKTKDGIEVARMKNYTTGLDDIRKMVENHNNELNEWLATKEMQAKMVDMLDEDGLLPQLLNSAESIFKIAGKGTDQKVLEGLSDLISLVKTSLPKLKNGELSPADIAELTEKNLNAINGFYGFYGFIEEISKEPIFKNDGLIQNFGIFTEISGIVSSVISAASNTDMKDAGDYIDDAASITRNISNLIEETNNLINKPGKWGLFWKASTGKFALAAGAIDATAQVFKDIAEYRKDGWNGVDTINTALGGTLAFMYGVAHKLSYGLDEVLYAGIDKLTGGNVTKDMSYLQKAIEGYKMLINDPGNAVSNVWNKYFGKK